MKKLFLPLTLLLVLGACGEESSDLADENMTEVAAPDGELDSTTPGTDEESEAVGFSDIVNGNIEEGAAVLLSGTVEELVTDDSAFIMFVLTADDQQILIRNMAETPVEVGQLVTVEGIYEGVAEEGMPLVSVSVIEME